MPLPCSGTIGLSDIQSEFGGPYNSGAQGVNIGISTGSRVAHSDFYCTSAAPAINPVIWEYGVDPEPVYSGGVFNYNNGYRINVGGIMHSGNSSLTYSLAASRLVDIFDMSRPALPYWGLTCDKSGMGRPQNVAEPWLKVLVDDSHPNMFPDHKSEIWDPLKSETNMNAFKAKGFKFTWTKWHNMARDTSKSQSYSAKTWSQPSGAWNQSYKNVFNLDAGLGAAKATVLGDWNPTYAGYPGGPGMINNSSYTPFYYAAAMSGAGSASPVSSAANQGWFWAFTKIELNL